MKYLIGKNTKIGKLEELDDDSNQYIYHKMFQGCQSISFSKINTQIPKEISEYLKDIKIYDQSMYR